MSPGVAALALAAGIAAGAGCKGRAAPVAARDGRTSARAVAPVRVDAAPVREVVLLRQVVVELVAPSGAHVPERAGLEARLGQLGSGVIARAEAKPPDAAARSGTLRAVVTYDRGGSARRPTVLMTVEASVDLGEALGVAARAAGERPITGDEAAAIDALAAVLVEQVATELTGKLDLRAGGAAELAAAATGVDPELAAWALELGGERRDPGLAAAAERALRASPRLRTAAIQYLVARGDPAAVPALAASADFADPDELAAIIEAVTALGGDEAREFLEMLAAGATDPDVAARAREGLERLARRAAAADAGD